MTDTVTADALAKFNEVFNNSMAADAYGRRMTCEAVEALVPLLTDERIRDAWWEAHREDCEEQSCRDLSDWA